MNKKETVRMLINHFFIIYTCTMFAAILFCSLNDPKTTEIEVSFLGYAGIFSLCADLPSLVYLSDKELTKKGWWIRTAVHTVLLEIVLLTVGYKLGMYSGILGFALFFMMVLLIDAIVRIITYINDISTAEKINGQLKKRRGE
ncbi:MAG: DUF3021 family protein [Oscillospiraceae bacterium]